MTLHYKPPTMQRWPRHHRARPDGALILHYTTTDNVRPAPAGLAPVER
jgi:hypothetical protein